MATTTPKPPPAPKQLQIEVNDAQITATWQRVVGASSYRVYRSENGKEGWKKTADFHVVFPDRPKVSCYVTRVGYYHVRSVSADGVESEPSNVKRVTLRVSDPLPEGQEAPPPTPVPHPAPPAPASAPPSAPAPPPSPGAVPAFLEPPLGVVYALTAEGTQEMLETIYKDAPRAGAGEYDEKGAYGPKNREYSKTGKGEWNLDSQKRGGDLVVNGIVANYPPIIEAGLRILRWGFQRMSDDGSFECEDALHQSGFLIEATAHSLWLLGASRFKTQFQVQCDELKPLLLKALQWLAKTENQALSRKRDAPYTHRSFLKAAAFGMSGVLFADVGYEKLGSEYLREGIGRQTRAGIYPEKNGYDSSYQATGICFAERYLVLCALGPEFADLYESLELAVLWEAGMVQTNGRVATSGNTRVFPGTDDVGPNGSVKTFAYDRVVRAFLYWGFLTKNANFVQLGRLVAKTAGLG